MMSTQTPQPSNTPAGTEPDSSPGNVVCHELAAMQHHWWWFLVLGISLVVLGTVAMGSTPFVTAVTVTLFGFIMVVGGLAQVVSAFWAGRWSGFMLQLLVGILYVVVGFILVDKPIQGAAGLTLLIAAFLMVGGLIRIVFALSERFTGWGWSLLNGAITLLLGLLIYREWPLTGLFAIGLFVGIEMIFNGWYWIMLAIGLKRAPKIEC